MTAVLEYWPLLLLPALLAAAPWVRRRNWIRAARRHWRAHPSIDQASHDRAPAVQEPRCRMCDHPVSHHDAGECWTDANGNEVDSDSVCPCWWLTLPGEELPGQMTA